MKNKILFICFVLLGLSLTVEAQKKSKGKKNAPAKKTAVAKKKTKAAAPKKGKAVTVQQTLKRNAGDTAIKGATIEIIQSYKPEVKNTPKPELSSNLPPAETTVPPLNYDVPQQSLSYTYTSFPLRPLALNADSAENRYANYVKVGAGNLSTIFLDGAISSVKGENYETNIHFNHLSQAGSMSDQKVSLTGIQANGSLRTYMNLWQGGIDVLRNQYNYYGYDHGVYNYNKDDVRQAYTGVKLHADMQNELEMWKGINYHPSISASLYGDKFDANERSIKLAIPVSYNIDTNLQLQLGINAAVTQFKNALFSTGNNVLQFTPGIKLSKGSLKLMAGLYPTFGKDGNSYILPNLDARFNIAGTQFAFNAGWQSLLRQNTYEQLSTRNPFMYNTYAVRQTRSDELYGGIQSNIGNHISFTGRLSWWQYNAMPLFVNDTAGDKKNFLVVYDNRINAISLQAAIRYQVANTFAVGFSGTWFNYYNHTFEEVWHEPGVSIKADLMIRPVKDLTITGYLSVMDQIYALNNGNNTTKLPTVFEIGGGAEYTIIPRLSLFLQANNLLNNNYQRWMGYNAFGINIFGGARLKF